MRGFIYLVFCIGLIVPEVCQAQYPSKNNRFLADEIKGCAGLSLSIEHNPLYTPALTPCGSGGITCIIVFGDGRPNETFVNGQTVTYANAGNFDARIVYSGTEANNDTISFAISPNVPPTFEVYSCSGYNAQVKITDTTYPQYRVDYNSDGVIDNTLTPASPSGSVSYAATPAVQTVTVRGYNGPGTANNCIPNTHTVNVVDPLPTADVLQVEVINTRDVRVDLDTRNTVLHRIMIGTNTSASFQQYKTFYSAVGQSVSETVPDIRPDDNHYCFRVDTVDPCVNATQPGTNIVCSLNFDGVAQNNQNVLSWTTALPSPTHELTGFRLNKDGGTLTNLATSPRIDTDVVCGTNYSYQLFATYKPIGIKPVSSISRIVPVTAISTNIPTPVRNISAMVNGVGNEVQLNWVQDNPAFTAKEYTLIKSVDGTFGPLATTTQPDYLDKQYTTSSPTCYKISYKDACNNVSPLSNEACPIQLNGNVNGNNEITLDWSAYSGWQNGILNYTVEQLNDQRQAIGTIDRSASETSYFDNTIDPLNQVNRFRIYAYSNEAGVLQSVSNEITITKNPNIYYPTAFTPNGDALNSTYKVIGQFVDRFEMRIFNRWGETMYSTTDLDAGWDGTYNGTLMPEATYVFRAKLTDQMGRTFDKSGSFFLIRKR